MELDNIFNIDCLEALSAIPTNTIDCIVTDPPFLYSMSATNSLHYQLCCEGAKYIIQPRAKELWQSQNILAAVELVCYGSERPDVYATNRESSTIIEVKTSHADFLADRKKYARSSAALAAKQQMGNYRYYLCPEGVIKPEELPAGWGLLYWNGNKVEKVRKSEVHTANHKYDVYVLCSILARECGTHKVFNYRKVK